MLNSVWNNYKSLIIFQISNNFITFCFVSQYYEQLFVDDVIASCASVNSCLSKFAINSRNTLFIRKYSLNISANKA